MTRMRILMRMASSLCELVHAQLTVIRSLLFGSCSLRLASCIIYTVDMHKHRERSIGHGAS